MISAHGMIIRRNHVTITEVRDVTPPPLRRKPSEKTLTTQDDDEYQMGLRQVGALSFELGLNVNEASHLGLIEAWSTGDEDEYEVQYPDGATWYFLGVVESIMPKAPVDGGLTAMVTIQPSGPIDLAFAGFMLTEVDGFLLLETGGRILL